MDEADPSRMLQEEYVNRREYVHVTMKDATQLTFFTAGVRCAAQANGKELQKGLSFAPTK